MQRRVLDNHLLCGITQHLPYLHGGNVANFQITYVRWQLTDVIDLIAIHKSTGTNCIVPIKYQNFASKIVKGHGDISNIIDKEWIIVYRNDNERSEKTKL